MRFSHPFEGLPALPFRRLRGLRFPGLRTLSRSGAALLGTVAVIFTLGGCAVHASPPIVGGYATFYADDVPPDIYAYPHVWYDGGYAYLVNDRWYYPSGGGWVVLRHEPVELYSYRRSYALPAYGRTFRQGAPPAYRESAPPAVRGYRQGAPPAYRPARPEYRYSAPRPAERER